MFQLTQSEKIVLSSTMRMILYFFALICVAVGIWKLADMLGTETFTENGIVENVQCVLLVLAGSIFGAIAWFHRSVGIVLMGLVSLCVLGFCREQDALLDEYLPVLSWRIGYFFPAFVTFYGLNHFRSFVRQVVAFLKTPAFSLMFCAMVMVIPFAQCIGHRPLIASVIEQSDSSTVFAIRRMIEESGELLGYVLIVLAAVELIFNLKKRQDV